MWGIIGGSGFEKFDGFQPIENLKRETPFGLCSEGLKLVELNGERVVFLPRHGLHHDKTPSEVNYRANIFALKMAGVQQVLAFSAVGSLQNELAPGDMVVPHQYIDRTKSLRPSTFCGDGIVAHVSLAAPTSAVLTQELKKIAAQMSFKTHFDKVALCVEGPYFSTKAESHLYRSWGADIIGMTAFPEYGLVREAGMAFLPCSFVTDYDCWKDDIPHVTVQEVMTTMKLNNGKAFALAQQVVKIKSDILQKASEKENGLKNAMMTPLTALNSDQQKWMSQLLS